MEQNQSKIVMFKIFFLHGINIAITVLLVFFIFYNPMDKGESSDIRYMTRICLICMVSWMGLLIAYDFKGSVVRQRDINVWKSKRYCHHIFMIMFYMILFMSGYHSFLGYIG